ncbi:hypothetical protein EDC30_101389 [Paucimonas lemoignei]|uniref:YtxH domain-containing protein n=1 Tax=Paucimonas lemoignei TaxID=29443 RepID=A0A4R3I320_PAULE|nr:hypothetical protein EDC30_101389 [Paucimonas lemoignei]
MERESHGLSRFTVAIGAAALGAAAMYLLDPQHGRRRRAVARDKVNSARIKTRKAAERTARDLNNRAKGIVAKTRKMMPQAENMKGQGLSGSQTYSATQSADTIPTSPEI